MSAALKLIFTLVFLAARSEAMGNETQTETTTTTMTSTTLTSTASTTAALVNKTANSSTTTLPDDKETDLDNETSTTRAEGNETDDKQKETDGKQTATSTTSATGTSFSEGEGLETEAVASVQGSIVLSVSSQADAEQLAADEAVAVGWRAAVARAAEVASERVELTVSVEPAPEERRLRAVAGSPRRLASAQISLSYVITLEAAASKAEARAQAGEVGAAIRATPPAELAADLAEEATKATGGDFGVQVQAIGDPTEDVVLQLAITTAGDDATTARDATTAAAASTVAAATTAADTERSFALPARLPGFCHALVTAALVALSL